MHIPSSLTTEIPVLTFEEALTGSRGSKKAYDAEKWIYAPDFYSEYRYILGTRGKNPLITVGVNPSTAEPDNLDNTLKSVERIALHNGYDSFIMFNVYAQRATRPRDMEKVCNMFLHRENMKAFEYVLSLSEKTPDIWAAWGSVIEQRPYLPACVADMADIAVKYSAQWFSAGARSKKGHPHHPLYLKKDTALDLFDINGYLELIMPVKSRDFA